MSAQGARRWKKLGIVAGAGDLPVVLAEHLRSEGAPYHVARIAPFAAAALAAHPGEEAGLGRMGERFAALKAAGCDAVVLAGVVRRPDFASLEFDARAIAMLPRVMAAAGGGDDALLRVLVEECEREGFRVVGAEEVLAALIAPAGALGAVQPSARDRKDIAKAAAVAAALGAWDVGQGAVVADGLVLALEAQEGTDLMLARVAALPEALRGTAAARRGVLAKRPKPKQERRVDLPTIGLATIENAARAGLAGVAVEAGGALVMERAALIARADALGLFVYGFDPEAP
ncbi:MAG: LpxI family protein [Hyphomonadaceae bacterium]